MRRFASARMCPCLFFYFFLLCRVSLSSFGSHHITCCTVRKKRDQESQHFLISWTEGEALEIVRGAERKPGLEQWRRLAALYDPLPVGRSLADSRQILSPPKAAQIDELSHTIQVWEILNNATENAQETSCLKTCD